MDEITEQFQSARVTTASSSNHSDLYKSGNGGYQEQRRREFLLQQKKEKNKHLDKVRGILDHLHSPVENTIKWGNYVPKREYRPNIYVSGFRQVSPSYNDVLMMSEWFVEKPQHFSECWCMVPCPKGKRYLVISHKGSTKFYTKYGRKKFQCYTEIPGGNRTKGTNSSEECCILDGFYNEDNNTFYIVDLLAWNRLTMTLNQYEFRHFWLESSLMSNYDLKTITDKNKVKFSLLPLVKCDLDSLNTFLQKYPPFDDGAQLDGFLFYHKLAQYVNGETPLVGWLYSYMIPEVIDSRLLLHPSYLESKPSDYVDQATFIVEFNEKLALMKQNNKKKGHKNAQVSKETEMTDLTLADVETIDMEANETPIPE